MLASLERKLAKTLAAIAWTDAAILAVGGLLALALRLSMINFDSPDYYLFFREWYQAIQAQGFPAIVTLKYDYTPSYLHLLYLTTRLFPHLGAVAAIKLPSILFDFIAAAVIHRLARLRYPAGPAPVFAALIALFAPTIVLNSAMWGQSESIFTAFLLLCLYFLLTRRDHLAGLAFGIAFAFKLQAIFLAPLLAALVLRKRLDWKSLLWIPLVYVVLMIPAWLAGRPLVELLLIYLEQSKSYPALTLEAPTLYAWLPESYFPVFYPAGLIWAGAAVFLFLALIVKSKAQLNQARLVQIGLAAVLLTPFFLPKMHERYFYPADLLAIVYAFFFPQDFYLAIGLNLISFFAYQPFLLGRELVPTELLALGILAVIVLVIRRLVIEAYSTE